MHYSEDPSRCRVDFFRKIGKWVASQEFEMGDWTNPDVSAVVKKALRKRFSGYYSGCIAVVLEPYSRYSYPVMLFDWDTD